MTGRKDLRLCAGTFSSAALDRSLSKLRRGGVRCSDRCEPAAAQLGPMARKPSTIEWKPSSGGADVLGT